MAHDFDPLKITYLGTTIVRGRQKVRFGIRAQDRERHIYIIGKTGVGKSTLLETMAIQDIRNGEGLIFLDPHGSSADLLLQFIPQERIADTIYFAPFDADYPIAFNIMEDIGYDKRHLVVSSLLSAFKKIWGAESFSSRMEHILSNTLLALLEYPDTTLLDINRMYAIPEFRRQVVARITDPQVRSFWIDEFNRYTDRFAAEATPAIQNKIGQFTSNPLIRNIIGQPKSAFDFRSVMDQRKILLINLSKGRIGEGNASLLGILFSTKVYIAALSRAEVTREEMSILPPVHLFVDEFQSFASETFADILSEARKYKLHLVLAHQYVEQMPEEVRSAVFGNVGTTVSFRVGPLDADMLTKVYAGMISMNDLSNLGKRQIYLSLMIDGTNSPVFLAETLDMFIPPHISYASAVRDHTREQYGIPRAQVEKMIADRLEEFSSARKQQGDDRQKSRGPQGGKPGVRSTPSPPPNASRHRGEEKMRADRLEEFSSNQPRQSDGRQKPRGPQGGKPGVRPASFPLNNAPRHQGERQHAQHGGERQEEREERQRRTAGKKNIREREHTARKGPERQSDGRPHRRRELEVRGTPHTEKHTQENSYTAVPPAPVSLQDVFTKMRQERTPIENAAEREKNTLMPHKSIVRKISEGRSEPSEPDEREIKDGNTHLSRSRQSPPPKKPRDKALHSFDDEWKSPDEILTELNDKK